MKFSYKKVVVCGIVDGRTMGSACTISSCGHFPRSFRRAKNEIICHVQNAGSMPFSSSQPRIKGQSTGHSRAFVTYCNFSSLFALFGSADAVKMFFQYMNVRI